MADAVASRTANGETQLQLIAMEWKQSWRPGVAALIGTSISFSLFSAVSSLFVEPLEQQFGWSRGEIAAVHMFGLILAFANPVLGHLIDRFGVRPVLSVGLILTAGGHGLLALMRGSLEYYYAVYFFFHLVGLSTTGLSFTRILSGAFDRTRGTALAFGRSSLALSGALMPLLLYPIIARFGTAGGFLMLGALILFIAFPLVRLWVPSKMQEIASGRLKVGDNGHRLRFLLTHPKVGVLCVAAALNYAPVVSLLSQMKPLAISKGLDAAMAVGAITVMGVSAAVGALLSGFLVDRFWAPAVAFVLNLAPAIGCLILIQTDASPLIFYGAILLLGIGQGAELDVVAYMTTKYFGLASYGTVFGLTCLAIAIGVAIGATLIGVAYDHFGNYDIALIVSSVCFGCAALCYLAMGRYPNQHTG